MNVYVADMDVKSNKATHFSMDNYSLQVPVDLLHV